ncbi:MAG: hypothetical protein EAZ87_03635 [Nostocales cyanobacterium]|nr:MAG: hypothetical protein EAZ87_03635 [Nostocales cyanobacterium]
MLKFFTGLFLLYDIFCLNQDVQDFRIYRIFYEIIEIKKQLMVKLASTQIKLFMVVQRIN